MYSNNIEAIVDKLREVNRVEQAAFDNAQDFYELALSVTHLLNADKKFYQNDYISPFLEDAENWCSNNIEMFHNNDAAIEIYQGLIEQNVKVDEFEVFKSKYEKYSLNNFFSCFVLEKFNEILTFYNKKLQEAHNTSIVYQLQDSQYCREQAQNDYDCLSYLYNLTSNRKMIFFKEQKLKEQDWSNNDIKWFEILFSAYIEEASKEELKEAMAMINGKDIPVKNYFQIMDDIVNYDPYLFARLNMVEQPVLRLNQVEVNEPAILVQLSEVGVAELENLDIPENNKILARNIIKNIQQANDYPLLNVNNRIRLTVSRVQTFRDIRYIFDSFLEQSKRKK